MRAIAMLQLCALVSSSACDRPQKAPTNAPASTPVASQQVRTEGFELALPQGWRVVHTSLGIEAHDPTDAIELVVSGAYPAADADTTREIVSAQGGIDPAAWKEHRVADLRVVSTAIVGSTRLDVHIVSGANGHVVVTSETKPGVDAATATMLNEIVDSVRIGQVVVERGELPAS